MNIKNFKSILNTTARYKKELHHHKTTELKLSELSWVMRVMATSLQENGTPGKTQLLHERHHHYNSN